MLFSGRGHWVSWWMLLFAANKHHRACSSKAGKLYFLCIGAEAMHFPSLGGQEDAGVNDYWGDREEFEDENEDSFLEEGFSQPSCIYGAECKGEGFGMKSFSKTTRAGDIADYAVEGMLGGKAGEFRERQLSAPWRWKCIFKQFK